MVRSMIVCLHIYVSFQNLYTFMCPFRIPVIPNDWRIPRFNETYG